MEMRDGRCLGKVEDHSLYRGERGDATSAICVLLPSPTLDAPTSQPLRWTVGALPHMVNVSKIGGSEPTPDEAHL